MEVKCLGIIMWMKIIEICILSGFLYGMDHCKTLIKEVSLALKGNTVGNSQLLSVMK